MYIQELILDGFKSYPVRTTISGWDPSFNAITGLNGSGKSNILDAICFVLGLTNMTSMRAQNQQDLIYKRGQAGITRASVTIVFDNSDREKSPVAMDHLPQITVTRQIAIPNLSKYLLNGHKSSQQDIQTLFQGVQLNINNPNFLIMQGRITKVLNMRPAEILGMIEEASGTRMFEEKKNKAIRDISKKEKKVQELEAILGEEITPKINKARLEKREYIEWQKGCAELEKVGRLLRALEWTNANANAARAAKDIAAGQEALKSMEKQKRSYEKEIKAAEAEVVEVQKQKDKELKKGGKVTKLEEDAAKLGRAVEKIKAGIESLTSTISDEETRTGALKSSLTQLNKSLEDKRKQLEVLTAADAKLRAEHDAMEKKYKASEELLQTLLTGLSSNMDGQTGGGYLGQIADARSRSTQANTEAEQAKMKAKMTETTLQDLKKRWKAVEQEAQNGARNLENTRKALEGLRQRMAGLGWDAEKEEAHERALREARDDVRKFTETRNHARRGIENVDFEYDLPYAAFDRNKVKGTVAKLVSVEEVNYKAATALEITAGGRLYNVVVETDDVGKQLLQKGNLKRRVTLIPLNRIESFVVSQQKIDAATRLSGGKARLALSLVGYSHELAKAMGYVFGNTFVCEDAETAKKITFSRDIGVKSVTLQGDVYDPSGTLSGGSAPKGSGMLIQVQALLDAEGNMQQAMQRLEALERNEQRVRGVRDQWRAASRELSMKERELALLEQQVGDSMASRVEQDVKKAEAELAQWNEAIKAAKQKHLEAEADIKKYEKDMKEFKNNKEGKTEELRKQIQTERAAFEKYSKEVTDSQKKLGLATHETKRCGDDIVEAEKGLQDAAASIQKTKKDIEKEQEHLRQQEAAHAEAERKLQEERATLNRYDDEINALEDTIKRKKSSVSDKELEIKKQEHTISTLTKEKDNAEKTVASLEKQYDWIEDEKDKFGKRGTVFSFEGIEIDVLRTKASQLEAKQNTTKKKINPKAMHQLESQEKSEAEIKRMITSVNKDKQKIFDTIEELDQSKREAVEKTWKKVNDDFGSIFGELLPGNFAKLQPPDGQDMMAGLEVKVRLGTVWKQSLTELSGGQRSLIALSLIMSLLQYKPAPMYILDEIDAALDLSHTQHIGQLFRNRFKGSQFIVVSLKEGLFTNANVLFRTRFRDGTSIVERTATRSGGGRGRDDEENVPPAGRSRR